jgi:hypothetical protein
MELSVEEQCHGDWKDDETRPFWHPRGQSDDHTRPQRARAGIQRPLCTVVLTKCGLLRLSRWHARRFANLASSRNSRSFGSMRGSDGHNFRTVLEREHGRQIDGLLYQSTQQPPCVCCALFIPRRDAATRRTSHPEPNQRSCALSVV